MSSNNSSNNKFERRPYDSSKKKSFSNYMGNRPKNNNINRPNNYSNKYNNGKKDWYGNKNYNRPSVPQATSDFPDRNATSFDFSAAIMMGMQQQTKPEEKKKENDRNSTSINVESLANNQNEERKFYDKNEPKVNTINRYNQSNNDNVERYQQNNNDRWSVNNSPGRHNSASNTTPRYVNKNKSRFEGSYYNNSYSSNSGTNNSAGNSSYRNSVGSRFDNSPVTPSEKNRQRYNGYGRDSNNYNSQADLGNRYTPDYNKEKHEYNNRYVPESAKETSEYKVENKELKKEKIDENIVEKPNKSHVLNEDNLGGENKKILEVVEVQPPIAKEVPLVASKVEVDEEKLQPLKTKVIFDDEEEDNYVIHTSEPREVVPESDLETDALDTPLKPRLKALDDTVESKKVIEQMRPTKKYNLNNMNKEDDTKPKKDLTSEIEAEAKYFASLSGMNKSTNSNTSLISNGSQRHVSIKRDPYGKTKLHTSVVKKDLFNVKKLIEEQGYDPNLQDYSGMTPLHYACSKGYYEIAEYLVSLPECDVNIVTEDNSETALFDACVKFEIELVKLLLEHKAKISIENSEKKNVLVYMKEGLEDEEYETEDDKKDLEEIIELLESYWDKNENDENSKAEPLKVEEDKKEKIADIKKESKVVEKPKSLSSENHITSPTSEAGEKELLDFDIMDIASKYGKEKFYTASCKGDYNYVGQYLQNGGKPDRDAFIECCKRGYSDLINLFLALTNINVNMKIPHSNGRNILMMSLGRGHADIMKLLIESGADYMHLDDDNRSVLYYAKKNDLESSKQEYEYLKSKIEEKNGGRLPETFVNYKKLNPVVEKKKEVSVPISPKRQNSNKSKVIKTPQSASSSNKSHLVNKSPSADNTANQIKRKFYQLTEDDLEDPQPIKIKKQPIIKKVKLGGTSSFASEPSNSVEEPMVVEKPFPESSIEPIETEIVNPGSMTPIENIKEQKTREIFEQMEKYEQIKKDKELKELEELKLKEKKELAEKEEAKKDQEREFEFWSGSLLCIGLRCIFQDSDVNKTREDTIKELKNVGPIYYKLCEESKSVYVLNLQMMYLFKDFDLNALSEIKNYKTVDDNNVVELNQIWNFYKDLFLVGYNNDKELKKLYQEEILNKGSLEYINEFEQYQKGLLKNIEIKWIDLNEVFGIMSNTNAMDLIIEYVENSLVEYKENGLETAVVKTEASDEVPPAYPAAYPATSPALIKSLLPPKIRYRDSIQQIMNDKNLW